MMVVRPGPAFVFSIRRTSLPSASAPGSRRWRRALSARFSAGLLVGSWALHPGLVFPTAMVFFGIGVWACEVTGRHLGVADHGAMVWDEVAAFLLILAIVPRELAWQAAAFGAFRFFDVAKPPPIRYCERRYGGGFEVMFDDLVAAAYALLDSRRAPGCSSDGCSCAKSGRTPEGGARRSS